MPQSGYKYSEKYYKQARNAERMLGVFIFIVLCFLFLFFLGGGGGGLAAFGFAARGCVFVGVLALSFGVQGLGRFELNVLNGLP